LFTLCEKDRVSGPALKFTDQLVKFAERTSTRDFNGFTFIKFAKLAVGQAFQPVSSNGFQGT